MAKNWLMDLTSLAKTDKTALELLRQLKSAQTDEEKEKAKQNGKEYIQAYTEKETSTTEANTNTSTTPADPEPTAEKEPEVETETGVADDQGVVGDPDVPADDMDEKPVQKIVEKKYDMSEPAFNPRLAKMGITREEELFKLGVYVRKLTREEKILIRRSIYQKKKQYMSATQDAFKKKQAEARAAKLADPAYQKYIHQQQLVLKVEEALKNHCNMEWMFKNIPGLTVEVLRELIQVPANANRFRAQKDVFIQNFDKKYGLTPKQEEV
jgi:hypothetical protein